MAIPNETLELTNSQHMPPVISLTGNELIPAANNVTDKLPVSLTPSDMGEYVHGQYTFQLTDYADTPTSLSTLLMVENGQTYKISINDVVNFAQANLTLTGTGLVTVTATGPSSNDILVPIASVSECNDAVRNDVAVTPAGLANYKARLITLEAQMAALLYVPISINSFSVSPNILEIGSTVGSVEITWSLNKPAQSLSMTNNPTPIAPTDTSSTIAGPFNTNQSWQLAASDGQTADTSTGSLVFRNKRYWGVSPNTTLSNSEILALSSEFTTSRIKDFAYNASGGSGSNYIYYAYPASFGALNAVTVGGLAFSDYTIDTITFTNASSHSSSYYLVRINNIQTGANIQVHWE